MLRCPIEYEVWLLAFLLENLISSHSNGTIVLRDTDVSLMLASRLQVGTAADPSEQDGPGAAGCSGVLGMLHPEIPPN